jgi:outer membrane protein assembly factor BamB
MIRKYFASTIAGLLVLALLVGFIPGHSIIRHAKGDMHEGFMFRGDLGHSGVFNSTVPANNTLLWSFETGSAIESSPAVHGDRIFFGAEDGRVYCLDRTSGAELWSFATGNEVDSTPAIIDGVVYVGSADSRFYALDSTTGEELWNYTFPSPASQIVSSPAVAGGLAFIGAKDRNLYAVNLTSHDLEWQFSTDDEIWSSPSIDWPFVYIGSLDGKLYSIWGTNGTEHWNFSADIMAFPIGFYASPMISNGSVYIGSEDNNLYRLNAETGEEIWRFTASSYIYASAAVANQKVFIHTQTSQNGFVYALPEEDPNSDGIINDTEVIWSFGTQDFEGGSSPAVADGTVLVGSTTGIIFCLDELTGHEIWKLITGGSIISSPIIIDGIVYFGARDGTLYAVGGEKPEEIDIEIIPEFPSIKGNRVMGISVLVTYRGVPLEGAFVNFHVTAGNLSQQGASTFPDGTQRIKYTAPEVEENVTVTVTAAATKYGYSESESTSQFTVEPSSVYGDVGSSSTFSLAKYWIYLTIIGLLIAVNAAFIVIRYKKSKKKGNETEEDTREGST